MPLDGRFQHFKSEVSLYALPQVVFVQSLRFVCTLRLGPFALQAPPGAAEGSRSVSLTERFYCRPSDLFEALTDERRIRAYTQVTHVHPQQHLCPCFSADADCALMATDAAVTQSAAH